MQRFGGAVPDASLDLFGGRQDRYDAMNSERSAIRILGIDPALGTTGYGVLEVGKGEPKLVEAGVVRGTRGNSLAARLREIHQGVVEIIESISPHSVAIEELYSHYQRPRTAILMGHARGVIYLAASLHNLPIVSYAATQVKRILTGNGRAPKSQMQAAIRRELKIAHNPEPADVADALAIALCHYYLGGKRLPSGGQRQRT
jgi:crossover junction endodeoxyribonuclease RuvC